jgi:uncharacterized membrane protein YecN with MAPEG domain
MGVMPFFHQIKHRLTFYRSIYSLISANSIGSNKLSGTVPTELGSLVNLDSLRVGEFIVLVMGVMPFSHQIKHQLTFYRSIYSLISANSTGSNKLRGAIPTELRSLVNLDSLVVGAFMLLVMGVMLFSHQIKHRLTFYHSICSLLSANSLFTWQAI